MAPLPNERRGGESDFVTCSSSSFGQSCYARVSVATQQLPCKSFDDFGLRKNWHFLHGEKAAEDTISAAAAVLYLYMSSIIFIIKARKL